MPGLITLGTRRVHINMEHWHAIYPPFPGLEPFILLTDTLKPLHQEQVLVCYSTAFRYSCWWHVTDTLIPQADKENNCMSLAWEISFYTGQVSHANVYELAASYCSVKWTKCVCLCVCVGLQRVLADPDLAGHWSRCYRSVSASRQPLSCLLVCLDVFLHGELENKATCPLAQFRTKRFFSEGNSRLQAQGVAKSLQHAVVLVALVVVSTFT